MEVSDVLDTTHDIGLPLGPMVPASGLTGPLVGNLDFARVYTNDAKITFQPENSDRLFRFDPLWPLTRCGQNESGARAHSNDIICFLPIYLSIVPLVQQDTRAAGRGVQREPNGDTTSAESHLILDLKRARM